jgi:predicted RNase H-like HicB family nuclease
MRLNTFDCAVYSHSNLVPKDYEIDDYQVRTPTDIIGQHIHLPKWDLTTTDGSANGWNYEDGTLAAEAVRERIAAINAYNPTGAGNPSDSAGRPPNTPLQPQQHPFFKQFGKAEWAGARTTIERWFFDPVVNVDGVDRGLGIIFTHDHYGPSTHQQVGLYSTVLVEPAGSTWVHNETGTPFYTRPDGGPTSWQAAILTGDIDRDGQNDSFREFYLEFTDFQHAYQPGVYVGAGQYGGPAAAPDAGSFRSAINPSVKVQANPVLPDLVVHLATCPGGVPRPCPEGITADDPGTFVVNYRNEPVALRIYDPAKLGPDGKPGMQADGLAGDLAFAFQSRTDRKIPELNSQPAAGKNLKGTVFPPPINSAGVGPGDPFTPMARAFMGDRIRVKLQAGGQEETHNATIHGVKWLQGGSGFGFSPSAGWRNAQEAGISEQFTFASPAFPLLNAGNKADHLYAIDASQDGLWNGAWGIVRFYGKDRTDLYKLPNTTPAITLTNAGSFKGVCPNTAAVRAYDVTAVLANDVLPNFTGATIVPADGSQAMHVGAPLKPAGGTLVYNPRPTPVANGKIGVLHDPTAMLYVRTADLVPAVAGDPACFVGSKSAKTFTPELPGCATQGRTRDDALANVREAIEGWLDVEAESASGMRIGLNPGQTAVIDSSPTESFKLRCGDYAEALAAIDGNQQFASK